MRNFFLAAALAAMVIPAAGCSPKTGSGAGTPAETAQEAFGRLSIDQLEAKMADAKAGKLALFIYDNNNKDRFEQGHIPGARWVDSDNVQASDLPQDKTATLVFYCANEH